MMPNAIMNNGEACISLTRILAPRDRYAEVDRGPGRAGPGHEGRRRPRSGHRGRTAGGRAPARPGGELHPDRPGGRGQGRASAAAAPTGLDTGWFVEPTVFVDVDNGMRIAQEEIFGPVLSVIPYDDDADAVRIANDSDYGLCGAVFSGDNDRGLEVARQVRTGTYMVNSNIPIDFSSPFGGYKASGVGPRVRRGRPRAVPREEDHQPAGRVQPDGVTGGRPEPAGPVGAEPDSRVEPTARRGVGPGPQTGR